MPRQWLDDGARLVAYGVGLFAIGYMIGGLATVAWATYSVSRRVGRRA